MGLFSTISLATRGRIFPAANKTLAIASLGWILSNGPLPPIPTSPIPPVIVISKQGGKSNYNKDLEFENMLEEEDIMIMHLIKNITGWL